MCGAGIDGAGGESCGKSVESNIATPVTPAKCALSAVEGQTESDPPMKRQKAPEEGIARLLADT